LAGIEEVKLLLDTHIWIWSAIEPARLKPSVARALDDEENELWLSPISIWELSVLVKKQRIELDGQLEAWVARALSNAKFREAPVTNDVVFEVSRLRFSHRDPADHFIAASAKVFDLTLVTGDPRLIKLKQQGLAVLAN
jgi:PIN domain nuclease of toxin-antitoxin system